MAPRYMSDSLGTLAPSSSTDSSSTGTHPKLHMTPLVVPQAQAVWCSPFVRGYGGQLAEEPYSIEPERWIAFVDGLNELLVKNVPLGIVHKIGMVMGFVPSVTIASAGAGVQLACGIGDRVRSKRLTGRYLKKANKLLFNPRGLSCHLYETEKALALLGLAPSTGIEAADLLEHARSRSGSAGDRAELSFHETTIAHSFRPFGDAVQPLTVIEQHADRPEDAGLVSRMNDLGVKKERKAIEKRQRKAAENLVKAEEKGKKQKKIDKKMKKYAAATGQKVEGVPAPTGLRAKLAGSKLWLVVLALEDERRLGDQAFDDEDAQEEDEEAAVPPHASAEEVKPVLQTRPDTEKVAAAVRSPVDPPPAYSGRA